MDPNVPPLSSDPGDPPGVNAYLTGDHRRLDALLEEVEGRARQGGFAEASARFGDFSGGLLRHIRMEEEVLFPAFEQWTGMVSGPTVILRAEHEDLKRILEELAEALEKKDARASSDALAGLREVLGMHNLKEERMLYPMTDGSAKSDEARSDLVRRMRRL